MSERGLGRKDGERGEGREKETKGGKRGEGSRRWGFGVFSLSFPNSLVNIDLVLASPSLKVKLGTKQL